MFEKVLIANRGEIALRVIRACRELGLTTVAVYSEADRDALHVRFADEDVCIGPAAPGQSYLDSKRIISAAEVTNAGAIHPGYGFLAENADFAEICESCGITFIGPTPDQIRQLGDKVVAKEMMKKAGVPVIPGSDGIVASYADARRIANEIGYPVMLKAVAGGGGKGMRMCRDDAELERGYHVASTEAANSFGNPDLYLEKLVLNPHHVEFQIIGDTHGNFVHVGERDCSIQRRHQKLIEETPSPLLTPELRQQMGEAAVRGAKMVGYRGVGTIEFLVDSDLNFYFMEMNTRIQVEHPVTEEAYDIDLVKEQIKVAMGHKLSLRQEELKPLWAAMECRVNAEDVDKDFRPTPGRITGLHIPGGPGVRVDRAVYTGYSITPYYDSMIAKLIVKAHTREEVVVRMKRALTEFVVDGVPTTIPFHKKILADPKFAAGQYDLTFVEKFVANDPAKKKPESSSVTLVRPGEEVIEDKPAVMTGDDKAAELSAKE
ncbi:MAG TPA: acetyl-CoA carboxylase biotin carboxylase subunit [candidate division Zixibacteria bacterium]|mgnify:CR=1 FL=1|nr:acetyl-CoA carboxylase biotin carboxylase subunit [candidate division Zixibacteria bacterium]